MTPKQPESSCHCSEHSGHVSDLKNCQKACDVNEAEHSELWDEIRTKTSNTFFVLLVTMFAASVTWQFTMYKERQELFMSISSDLSAIKTELKIRK